MWERFLFVATASNTDLTPANGAVPLEKIGGHAANL
jgi:hypothetical protein